MQHLFSGEAEIHHHLMTLRDNARTKDQVVAEYDILFDIYCIYQVQQLVNSY